MGFVLTLWTVFPLPQTWLATSLTSRPQRSVAVSHSAFAKSAERRKTPVAHSPAPISDPVIIAVARLVDDAKGATREPSHSDIDFRIDRAGLKAGDPKSHGQTVGKAKRIRGALNWALENNPEAGEALVASLIALIRGFGGFRESSPNFVGAEAIRDALDAFRAEGYELSSEGELRPLILEGLSGVALTSALETYVRRAKRGADDAALVTGTGKDLLEATAAHILRERFGTYSSGANFPTLLGQAFVELGLATPQEATKDGEPARKRLERAMYEMGCAINQLRNKEGTGHGRPWLPTVTEVEARIAVEFMGTIAERLLAAHRGV
jgi:hypothetical protein